MLAILFAAIATLIFGHVFSNGICCADDATNAIVAKNLAAGLGYLNSVPIEVSEGPRRFDPGITTGPTLNVPAALMIAIWGNVPWAPGFVTAFVSLTLLGLIYVALSRWDLGDGASRFLSLFIVLLYAATAGAFFEHWYSLIGELPAALLCVLACVYLARGPQRIDCLFLAGTCFGLAVVTKLVAMMSLAPAFAWLVWNEAFSADRIGTRLKRGLVFGGSVAVPLSVVELWKLIALGVGGYVSNTRSFVEFVRNSTHTDITTIGERWATSASQLHIAWGAWPSALAIVAVATLVFVRRQSLSPPVQRLVTILTLSTMGNAVWWFAQSNPWPRYALIGFCLYLAAISCLSLIRRSAGLVVVTVGVLACVHIGSTRLSAPVAFVATYRFAYTPRVENLLKTAALLDQKQDRRPFVMGWWGTAGDIEYALHTTSNFVSAETFPGGNFAGALLVRNKTWVSYLTTPAFSRLETICADVVLDAPPYQVTRCPAELPAAIATARGK